jgi:hypothetical protein
VIKVWGMVMWLHLVQMIDDVPGKFNIAYICVKKKRKGKGGKKMKNELILL